MELPPMLTIPSVAKDRVEVPEGICTVHGGGVQPPVPEPVVLSAPAGGELSVAGALAGLSPEALAEEAPLSLEGDGSLVGVVVSVAAEPSGSGAGVGADAAFVSVLDVEPGVSAEAGAEDEVEVAQKRSVPRGLAGTRYQWAVFRRSLGLSKVVFAAGRYGKVAFQCRPGYSAIIRGVRQQFGSNRRGGVLRTLTPGKLAPGLARLPGLSG